MTTTTGIGRFPVGFRQTGGWLGDADACARFAVQGGFAAVDLTAPATRAQVQAMADAGVRVGTVDPIGPWSDFASPDAGKRDAAATRTAEYVAGLAGLASTVFTVPVAEDQARPRRETFAFAVDGYRRLCEALARVGGRLSIEGWPGCGPHYASIGCTPADLRALLKELPANAGVNFDPSHLVRMGIDPLRFVDEFGPRILHVHGKDTELLADGLYEHGNLQDATFAPARGWGGWHWRYCIPGAGHAPWPALLGRLAAVGYRGAVSIELEDERFNGSEQGERSGFEAARRFLAGAGAARATA